MSTATILVDFVLSTVGFSLFLYGRKQVRLPQAVAGVLLMACPFAGAGPLWTSVIGGLLLAGLWLAVHGGW